MYCVQTKWACTLPNCRSIDIKIDMVNMNSGRRYRVPSTSALLAFESAARHCNFTRAAEELNTSQSAVSRHIVALEKNLSTCLFERHNRSLSLTEQGELFYRAVVAGLEGIQSASHAIANTVDNESVTIACTHTISHLVVMPRFESLQRAVGSAVHVRVMAYEYDVLETVRDPRIDLMFSYHEQAPSNTNIGVVFPEAIVPVCSPAFAEANGHLLNSDPGQWAELPFLQLSKRNGGWSSWEDWFKKIDTPTPALDYLPFDNYTYLLEAACAGRGLALGWKGLVDRHLQTGTLVRVGGEFVKTGRVFCAELTPRGSRRDCARACMDFLTDSNLTGASRL